MIIVEIFPICDFCDESYPDYRHPNILTKKAQKDHMKDRGWIQHKGKDMCPECVLSKAENCIKPLPVIVH